MNPADMNRADLLALALELGNSPMFQHRSDIQSRRTLEPLDDEPLRHKVEELVAQYWEAHDAHFNSRRYPELADMDRSALIVRLMELGNSPIFQHIYDLQNRRLLELLEDGQLRGKIASLNDEQREAHD